MCEHFHRRYNEDFHNEFSPVPKFRHQGRHKCLFLLFTLMQEKFSYSLNVLMKKMFFILPISVGNTAKIRLAPMKGK